MSLPNAKVSRRTRRIRVRRNPRGPRAAIRAIAFLLPAHHVARSSWRRRSCQRRPIGGPAHERRADRSLWERVTPSSGEQACRPPRSAWSRLSDSGRAEQPPRHPRRDSFRHTAAARSAARRAHAIKAAALLRRAQPEAAGASSGRFVAAAGRPLRKPRSARAWWPRSRRSSRAGASGPTPPQLAPRAAKLALGRQSSSSLLAVTSTKALVQVRGRSSARGEGPTECPIAWKAVAGLGTRTVASRGKDKRTHPLAIEGHHLDPPIGSPATAGSLREASGTCRPG